MGRGLAVELEAQHQLGGRTEPDPCVGQTLIPKLIFEAVLAPPLVRPRKEPLPSVRDPLVGVNEGSQKVGGPRARLDRGLVDAALTVAQAVGTRRQLEPAAHHQKILGSH